MVRVSGAHQKCGSVWFGTQTNAETTEKIVQWIAEDRAGAQAASACKGTGSQ